MQRTAEQLTRRADEGPAYAILAAPRLVAHQHQAYVERAFAEHRPRCVHGIRLAAAALPMQPAAPSPDSVRSARDAGLRWVDPGEPGIARLRRRSGFAYRTPQGRALRDSATLERIRKLAIPPAWSEVWICTDERGHIQATGRDGRGRKQYRYHADWQAQRGQTKFEHLIEFAKALPRIRRRVQAALAEVGTAPSREHVLATLVRLLDTTWLRVGNAEYARDNASFGLSTLHNRHGGVRGGTVTLAFKGKSGVRHEARIEDRRIARIVRACRELPGQALFQYVDAEGQTRRIGSADINDWLADAAATRVTAKDFRTWHGSVQALDLTLAACADDAPPMKAPQVLAQVARRLGNTPVVCRKSYIHPGVLALGESLADDAARGQLSSQPWVLKPPARRGLGLHERRLLGLLMQARKRRR